MSNGPWDPAALATLREWAPAWTEVAVKMSALPGTSRILPPKTVELIGLAVSAACTNLDADGTRRHIRAALDAGANRDEIGHSAGDGLAFGYPHM